MVNPLFVLGIIVVVMVTGFLFLFSWLSWNIPITVLRFTGDKRRPMVIHKKGKKQMVKGVPHLRVKGYKDTIRDFKSEFYYPGYRSKYGALILWEFEDGWLTPAIPTKKKLTPEEHDILSHCLETVKHFMGVDFTYSPEEHHKLKLKVVDDVDMEFLVEGLARTDKQYTSGWQAFLDKYANHAIIIITVVCLLVGFIMYLKESPNLAASCLNNLKEVAKEGFLQQAAQYAPGG